MTRRSFWAWGNEDREPTSADYAAMAQRIHQRYGVSLDPPRPPTDADLNLRAPRILPHPLVAEFCSTDDHDRAAHTYGRSFRDRIRAFNCQFPNPPDVIAYPRTETELTTVLDWCTNSNIVAIPYGGGSTVVAGIEPPEADAVVTIDLTRLDQVLEIDDTSRAARIQAGVLRPRRWKRNLRPHGYTLRHFPQSFRVLHPGRLDRHPQRRPLRHQPHPHRRLRGIGADGDAVRRVGIPPPPRQRRRPVARPHGHRQRGHPGRHHRGLDAHPGPAHGSAPPPASCSMAWRPRRRARASSPRPSSGRPTCVCLTRARPRTSPGWMDNRRC